MPKPAKVFAIPSETDWSTLDLDRAETLLAELTTSTGQGRLIVSQRLGSRVRKEYCIVCKHELPKRVERGREIYAPVYTQPERDPSGVYKRKSICTQHCYVLAVSKGLLRNRVDPVAFATPRVPVET